MARRTKGRSRSSVWAADSTALARSLLSPPPNQKGNDGNPKPHRTPDTPLPLVPIRTYSIPQPFRHNSNVLPSLVLRYVQENDTDPSPAVL